MPPGIAVAHGIEGSGVVLVDEAVAGDVADVIISVVSGLAEALEVVPEEAVLDWIGFEEVGAAEQG